MQVPGGDPKVPLTTTKTAMVRAIVGVDVHLVLSQGLGPLVVIVLDEHRHVLDRILLVGSTHLMVVYS